MLTTFEDITYPLTEEEKEVLPILKHFLETYHRGKEKAVTNPEICSMLTKYNGKNWTGERMRKLIHNARVSNYIPNLVSSSNGYFIAVSRQDIADYANSLRGRVDAIVQVIETLEKQAGATFSEIQGSLF